MNKRMVNGIIVLILIAIGLSVYFLDTNGVLQATDVMIHVENGFEKMELSEVNMWRSLGIYAPLELHGRFKGDDVLYICAYEYQSGQLTNDFKIASLYKDNTEANVAFHINKDEGYRFSGGNGVQYDTGWFSPYLRASYGMDLANESVGLNKGQEVIIGIYSAHAGDTFKTHNMYFPSDFNELEDKYLENDRVIIFTAKIE
ncbi:hypothetical protein EZV73_23605 [Acidaminobacter sp. JC074]|uniref:hypothetical protein n=1 Tax=Acidaminobacter sp. JC074 TaxID=2530199 RepID=UPI001F0D0059|nr:hypothetical protein [Acidaminobacter sp. JC074]MCH4890588.1 hypothetical protein [Acidaminobacter sp. JC074]